jgi:hypothetical protein
MFVKWSCGCKGLKIKQPDGVTHDIVLEACDGDRDFSRELSFWDRDMQEKGFEPLHRQEIQYFLKEMRHIIAHGYSHRTIKACLGIT